MAVRQWREVGMASAHPESSHSRTDRTMTANYDDAMSRAIELSLRGPARGVNPRVGCVILDPNGAIIAEGWHDGAGTAHAEVAALARLEPGEAQGATAVVTLEPCNHTGHTGPCSTALIRAGVTRVVYGVDDPGLHSGGGAAKLRSAGIEVVPDVRHSEIASLLDDWLIATRLGRPFVRLKWASSLDGRTAAKDGTSQWITGTAARQRVHEQRESSDAIVVGTGTILADNPSLTARGDAGELLVMQPVPVVVGFRDIPDGAAVRAHPNELIRETTHDVRGLLQDLHRRGMRQVFVEGGPTLASAFVAAGLVDEYLIYLAPSLIGGPKTAIDDIGVTSIGEQRLLDIVELEKLGRDLLVVARPRTTAERS